MNDDALAIAEAAVDRRNAVIRHRHLAIIERRMEQLEQAIRSRSWDDTETEYDRVLGAVQKLRRNTT
jgi:hypothetical protein